ncbi:MAG: hypothetical protein QOE68_208 [Thermoanaerobaculia bacterium]|jgi:hypothetical protein|nr:hypothetical protein [Thermoanaerobaculia bacterium]
MTEVYRKWGHVVRYQNGVFVSVSEAGEAFENDGVFQARPAVEVPAQTRVSVPHSAHADLQTRLSQVHAYVTETQANVAQTLLSVRSGRIERFIASAGTATHETDGATWTEESRRVHISLIKPPLRALIDLASFDVEIVSTIADALARAGDARNAPKGVRLAPNVSAALLPSLIGELAMEQTGGGFDGRGRPIETRAVTHDAPPNWYRPGYAVRPVRAWMNIRALPFGRIDPDAPLGIALLEPVHGTALRILCVDGGDVFPTTLDASHIAAVSRAKPVWYPYAAGSFGAEMML